MRGIELKTIKILTSPIKLKNTNKKTLMCAIHAHRVIITPSKGPQGIVLMH